MEKTSVAALLAIAGIAYAVTYGPFSITAMGKEYINTSFDIDASAEFEGANRLTNTYLAPILNTPGKIKEAVREGTIRIVYTDGQIAEFKIKRWPSSNPIEFESKLASANQQVKHSYGHYGEGGCEGGPGQPITIPTGYWGSRSSTTEFGDVSITGFYVSTGSFSFYPPTHNAFCP